MTQQIYTTSAARMEPSGIRGWVAITDPNTRQHWVPVNLLSGRGELVSYPGTLSIRFRQVTSLASGAAQLQTVEFRTGNGFNVNAPGRYNAWYYSISFSHDTAMSGAPIALMGLNPSVKYNPNHWAFESVTVESYRHWESPGRSPWQVDFARRSAIFPELPDTLYG